MFCFLRLKPKCHFYLSVIILYFFHKNKIYKIGLGGYTFMSLMKTITQLAKKHPQVVAFPEATNQKILQAAYESVNSRICHPLLVGPADQIKAAAESFHIPLDNMQIFDMNDAPALDQVVSQAQRKRPDFNEKTLKRKAKNPLYTALMLQIIGQADCTFAGINYSTGEVIIAGQFIVGMKPGISTISSFGIFDIPGHEGSEGTLLGFGDSAVCINPSSKELADIAITACDSIHDLCQWEPRCALLSYSSAGSGESELVKKVVDAVKIANELRPDLKIDGEFQLDAAINPIIAAKKIKRKSPVAGKANIIIWPDLNVGNISVKLLQQFANANAYGPSLQGFSQIISDCSRSADIPELVGNIAISCVRAYREKLHYKGVNENAEI